MKNSASSLAMQFSLFDFDQIETDQAAQAAPAPVSLRPVPLQTVDVAPPPVANDPSAPLPALDFSLWGGRDLAPTWKGRARDNIAAIRLLSKIDEEARHATPAEQTQIAKFIGFGATDLATNCFVDVKTGEFRSGWQEIGQDLVNATTGTELQCLMRATQYAHYTPEDIVKAMWQGVEALGFFGGQILEPGCGSGLFMALRPADLDPNSVFMGIENDPVTARVARALFPKQIIRCEDFDKAKIPDDFDLVIGNPPFSNLSIRNKTELGKLGLSLHDYFIAKSIEHLRPGGIAMFVTSRYSMDKSDPKAREFVSGMADFLGAVRLPRKAMHDEAGTEVVVDILMFRKRHAYEYDCSANWLDVTEIPGTDEGNGPLRINGYFIDNPDMVLGEHEWASGQFGMEYTCAARAGFDLAVELPVAIARVTSQHVGIYEPSEDGFSKPLMANAHGPQINVGDAASEAALKEGSYFLDGGTLYQVVNGVSYEISVKNGREGVGIFPKHAGIIKGLVPIRDAVRGILRAQLTDQPYGHLQDDLAKAYKVFVRANGPINKTITSLRPDPKTGVETEYQRRPNLQPFMDDPDVWLVSSIEEYDEETDKGTPGPIFTDRVVHAPSAHEVHSSQDAHAISLHETGRVDLGLISSLLGVSEQQALIDLDTTVYLDPIQTTAEHDLWVTADEALSGAVRTKLAQAKEAAQRDPRFVRNIEALEAVQPTDLKPSDITARLGAPWIATKDIEDFISEVMEIRTQVHHTIQVASWSVNKTPFLGHAASTSTWGTGRRGAGDLMEDALNSSIPKIWDVYRDENGNERRELNTQDTEAAKEKLGAIKAAFEKWIWQDADRADRLVRVYNDLFNNLVPRLFDGKHLRLPGASNAISLRPHQKRVIWRIIAAGSTYVAHAVGSGKTFSLCAAVMEQKRLGLVNKAMIVVPGHCLAQISREFLMLYPTARILVADELNFAKPKRQRFLARAATGNWDAIIITHDAFKFIPTPTSFERMMVENQIDSFVDLIRSVDKDDRMSRKRLERMKEGMKAKLEGLKARKDDLLHIGEIGIDQILVDEAQQFRKLSFATNQSDLKGVDPDGSQRSWDLYVKSKYLDTLNPGRSLVLASGTPITNTLGEMFSVQRFLQFDELEMRGLHEFDAWAANFGETRTELELQPSGSYKPVTRFSEFVNVADLMAMYRSFADVVLKDDLREYVKLPTIKGGKREIVVAPSGDDFKAYQKILAKRIKAIQDRTGQPKKGDDILLSVITDGRHAAIDLRFVLPGIANDNDNKLNTMIRNIHRIYTETSDRRYTDPETKKPYSLPGGVQMVFSDLGTEAAMENRGFSAYVWVKEQLIAAGIPADEIAFMQHYKKSAAKQRLFNELNSGRKRVLIGSTATMGTGVNAQQRLVALHHLDVPWLVSDIEQREGRIERQGNQNDEIELYAYALRGSVDATNWQMLERKARFINLAMSGDRSIRRLEDVGSDVNQFALAKALASGDERLMQKAGLEAELARLIRLRDAHVDDQYAVRRTIEDTRRSIAWGKRSIGRLEADVAKRISTKGDKFVFKDGKQIVTERKEAGDLILTRARLTAANGVRGNFVIGSIGGFDIEVHGYGSENRRGLEITEVQLSIMATDRTIDLDVNAKSNSLGIIARIENVLREFEHELENARSGVAASERRLPAYEARLDQPFTEANQLQEKLDELAALEADLAATKEEEEAPTLDLDPEPDNDPDGGDNAGDEDIQLAA